MKRLICLLLCGLTLLSLTGCGAPKTETLDIFAMDTYMSLVAIGDGASPMFTAGYTDRLPQGLDQPVATLPLAIFFQLSAPQAEVQDRAYAAAVVLTIIVLVLSVTGRYIMRRFSKNKIL